MIASEIVLKYHFSFAHVLLVLIIPLTTLIPHSAFSQIYDAKKIEDFLSKNKPCKVAMASYSQKTDAIPFIYCIWDGVLAEGSIRKAKGCFLGRYDFYNGKYQALMNYGAGLQARSQPKGVCTKEIAQDILMKYSLNEYGMDSTRPFLAEMRKDDKTFKVLYDEYGILNAQMLKSADDWKISAKKNASPRKSPKNLNCKSEMRTNETEIWCMDAESIAHSTCNLNLSEELLNLRKEIYQAKTGNKMPPCPQK